MILFNGKDLAGSGPELAFSCSPAGGQVLELHLVALGGGRADLDIDITEPGTDVRIRGLYISGGDDRLDIKVNLTHSAGGSVSDQMFKGIVYGKARATFDGLIKVARDAQKTEAYQNNRNIQLSDEAYVQTSPQLEIYADDVKCSHGATVGALDEEGEFYMRSRGITAREARRLQMISFLAPVMEGLDDNTRADVAAALDRIDL